MSTDGRHLILAGLRRIALKTYVADGDDDANGPQDDDMADRWPPFYRKSEIRRGEADDDRLARNDDAESRRTTKRRTNDDTYGRERGVYCFINVQQARRRPHISVAVREPMTTLDRAHFLSRVRRNRWNS